ncbi:MAG TPA: sulfotransferase [Woeseiaceae bacterium]|nr:sulfotransferase [Woeseiaceae bacterium]
MNDERLASATYTADASAVKTLLAKRSADDAATAGLKLVEQNPDVIEPLLLLARARQQQGRFDEMLQLTEVALEKDPQHLGAGLQFAEANIFCGRHDRAQRQLAKLEQGAGKDANLLQQLAQYYAHATRHGDALRCYRRATELEPDNPQFLYNLAASLLANGELAEAEKTYTAVINANPHDYDAWQNRSNLRSQTAASNHVSELVASLARLRPGAQGETALCYALAKEYEDLGKYSTSFLYLKRGADARRRRLPYDVATDVSVMKRIATLFNAPRDVTPLAENPGPIFVMGLPRSGTTLVDRIISSHSRVTSMGEINDFALALTRLGQVSDKNRLLEVSLDIDPEKLGAAYLASVKSYGYTTEYFIDKTPANYLYVGLMQRALPGARFIHLQRHPLDSCLAMYRTLFRMGYPFSYDLTDLAEYYIAYDRLMQHWHAVYPGLILDVSYEELVDAQERVSRDIISHCQLGWEAACLSFEKNSAPVATASAAQVRKPMYRDALARWRHYENQLEPLKQRLEDAGIDCS